MKQYKSVYKNDKKSIKEQDEEIDVVEIAMDLHSDLTGATNKDISTFKKQLKKKVNEIYKQYKKDYKKDYDEIMYILNEQAMSTIEDGVGGILEQIIVGE